MGSGEQGSGNAELGLRRRCGMFLIVYTSAVFMYECQAVQ